MIVGASDEGKSSILRALKWLCLNQPRGDSFIRHGSDFCKVTSRVDGESLAKERGEVTRYVLNGGFYDAVGTSIPQAIQDLLQVGEINFQNQLDAPFWFSLTPGEVAKELNGVVNLAEIDRVFENINSLLRRLKSEESVIQDRLTNSEQEALKLAWVEDADRDWKAIEALEEDVERQVVKVDLLDSLYNQALEATQTQEQASQAYLDAESVNYLASSYFLTFNRVDLLSDLITEYHDCERLNGAREFLSSLQELASKVSSQRTTIQNLQSLTTRYRREEDVQCKATDEKNLLEEELNLEVCPLCGKKTT